MSAGNVAYLALVLTSYVAFMLALGVFWLRSVLAKPPHVQPAVDVIPAHQPGAPGRPARRRASAGRRRAA